MRSRLLSTPPPVLVLAALLLASPSIAQQEEPLPAEPAPQVEPAQADVGDPHAQLEVLTNLRGEYLQGAPVLVLFRVVNRGDQAVKFADLNSRPWRVRFDVTGPDGRLRSSYTTPPEVDPGQTWSIRPRGQRRVLLEVPSSRRLKKGQHKLVVRIQDDAGELVLAEHSFTVEPAAPVGGSVWYEPLGVERSGHQVAWVHKAKQGHDLYLHHSNGRTPGTTLGDYHLLNVDQAIDPVLAMSRPQDRWDRHIYWQRDPRTIEVVQLQGAGQGLVSDKPLRIETPYPEVQLIGRGSTDASGGLHIPIWIPAPSGKGGELRVISVRDRSGPRFRQVVRMSREPAWIETAVDSSGELRVLLSQDSSLDLYTLSSVGDMPAAGQKVFRPEGDDRSFKPTMARFGTVPGREGEAGGFGVLTTFQDSESIHGRWFTLSGRELHRFQPQPVSAGALPVDLLPQNYEPFGVLMELKGGTGLLYLEGERKPVGLGARDAGTLLKDGEGNVLLRAVRPGGPVSSRLVRAGD